MTNRITHKYKIYFYVYICLPTFPVFEAKFKGQWLTATYQLFYFINNLFFKDKVPNFMLLPDDS